MWVDNFVGKWGTANTGRSTSLQSAYPYKTAEEHYNALLAEAKANGGPTVYDRDHPPPDWDGYYNSPRRCSRSNGLSATTSRPQR